LEKEWGGGYIFFERPLQQNFEREKENDGFFVEK